MYAIVKTGGKQYRVERGQRLLIERLAAEEGSNVTLEPILYRSEEAVFDRAGLERVQVTAKVLAHVRGEKLRVFKFKPKRGYKRRTGHRQDLTQIEVTEIALGSSARTGAKQQPETSVPAGEAKAPAARAATPKASAAKAAAPKATAPTAAAPEAKASPAKAKAAKPPAGKAAKATTAKAGAAKPAKPAAKRAAKPAGKAAKPAAKPATDEPAGAGPEEV